MKIIGLSGGIASGKSAVARFMESRGVVVIDADAIAHEVLLRPEVVGKLTDRWGSGIVDDADRPIRSEIAKRVFGATGSEELNWLEALLHPLVRTKIENVLEQLRVVETRVAILDVPLLFERNWQKLCDCVIFVDAPLDQRRARAAERGWDAGELKRREARQWDVERKQAAADRVIENHADLTTLHATLTKCWDDWNIGD